MDVVGAQVPVVEALVVVQARLAAMGQQRPPSRPPPSGAPPLLRPLSGFKESEIEAGYDAPSGKGVDHMHSTTFELFLRLESHRAHRFHCRLMR